MRNKILNFYAHIGRMNNHRITKQIYNLLNNYKSKITLLREVWVHMDTIRNRRILKKKQVKSELKESGHNKRRTNMH